MSAGPSRILLVDDDESLRSFLTILLQKEGYEVRVAATYAEAVEAFRSHGADLVLQDVRLPDRGGIDLLRSLRQIDPQAVVLVMTAYTTWADAVEAMRLGAFDYLRKPFDNDDIKATLARALRLRALRGQKGGLPSALEGQMVGHSPAIRRIHEMVRRVAATDATVLIQGESGTGKELIARALHTGSPRAQGPFVSVNCGAFTETLLESELFGHKRGSFTGAVVDKQGLVEVADGGTFFMDEISEMPTALQAKLLRLLEEKEFIAVGATSAKKIDVRFVAATNRVLMEEVRARRFREDLFYRLNVVPIEIPSLRDRVEDIPLLAGHFLSVYAKKMHSELTSFGEDALRALVRHPWPGNVRELENCVQRAVALARGKVIGEADLDERIVRGTPSPVASPGMDGAAIPPEGIDLDRVVADVERGYIRKALAQTGGNITKSAALLGLTFRTLRYKIKKLGMEG